MILKTFYVFLYTYKKYYILKAIILHANLSLIVVTFYLPSVTLYLTIAIFPKKVCYHTKLKNTFLFY